MCMEDIRIGRRKRGIVLNLSVGVNADVIIPTDKSRTHMTILSNPNANILWNLDTTTAGLVAAVLPPTGPNVDMDIESNGDIVTRNIALRSGAGTIVVSILLTRLDEE